MSRFPGARTGSRTSPTPAAPPSGSAATRPGSGRRRSRPTPTRRRPTRAGSRSSRARPSSWRCRGCATQHPFRLLDPSKLTEEKLREAATIKGALRHGAVIDVEQVPKVDLILCGSVAVNLKGARVGKGGGYSDLEYALLAEAGTSRTGPSSRRPCTRSRSCARTCRCSAHDIPVDLIATPRAAIEVERAYQRPRGIFWDHLQPPQIHEIPVLERMGYA